MSPARNAYHIPPGNGFTPDPVLAQAMGPSGGNYLARAWGKFKNDGDEPEPSWFAEVAKLPQDCRCLDESLPVRKRLQIAVTR